MRPERWDRRTRASGDSAEQRHQTTLDSSVAENKVSFNLRGLEQGPFHKQLTHTVSNKIHSSLNATRLLITFATAAGGCFLVRLLIFHLFKRTADSTGQSAPV